MDLEVKEPSETRLEQFEGNLLMTSEMRLDMFFRAIKWCSSQAYIISISIYFKGKYLFTCRSDKYYLFHENLV